jgi:hypothetical protein
MDLFLPESMSTLTLDIAGFDTLDSRERARTMVRLALRKRQAGGSPASDEDLSAARELAHCAMTRWFAGMEAGPLFAIASAVLEDLGDSVGAARTRALLGLYLSECITKNAEEEAELRLLALECIRRCLDGLTESLPDLRLGAYLQAAAARCLGSSAFGGVESRRALALSALAIPVPEGLGDEVTIRALWANARGWAANGGRADQIRPVFDQVIEFFGAQRRPDERVLAFLDKLPLIEEPERAVRTSSFLSELGGLNPGEVLRPLLAPARPEEFVLVHRRALRSIPTVHRFYTRRELERWATPE